jgi:hypothetical protein
MGSSVYFIFDFIYFPAFPPIPGADYSYLTVSIRKSYGHDFFGNSSKAMKTLLSVAVFHIFQDHTISIQKSKLCNCKLHTVFSLIQFILGKIPLEIRSLFH